MRRASRRSLLTAGASAALLTGAAASASAAASATTTIDVWLRATASWSAAKIVVIPAGSAVSLTGASSGDWREVTWSGRTGWVAVTYLKTTVATIVATDTTTLDVWLRATASWSAVKVVVVPKGSSVTRTGTVSGEWVQVTWSGRTGWIAGAYLAPRVIRTSTVTPVLPRTGLWQTFTYGTQSSTYHVWADGVDAGRPTGVLWYIDGDYTNPAWSRVRNPTGTAMAGIAAEANRRNLVCVCIDTPDSYRDGAGYTWWYDRAATAPYFRAFAAKFNTAHAMDPARQWLMGYSGGAQFTTRGLMAEQQTSWGMVGGGAILVGGGGQPWTYSETGMVPDYRRLRATWVVGSLDVAGATVPATWSALENARAGRRFFQERGYPNTVLTELAGVAHSYDLAAVMRPPLDAAGVVRMR